ncbi:MAG: beta-lactamase family protein [Eubacterium sp.]|nr:beta-lactamase family protein [Eubacterium sp.]
MKYESLISEGFSGVISFLSNGVAEIKSAYGYADLPNRRENTIDTKFATATAGKSFIACAIMRLIEQGRLRLNSQIGNIIDVHLGKIDRSVTIKELLTHTSGIPDYFYETALGNYAELFRDYPSYRVRKPKDLLPIFINKPMTYDGYGRFSYINSGYTLLAMAIESITGKPFDVYLKEEIFDKCEMNDTGYYSLDRLPPNTANNYLYDSAADEYYSNIYATEVKGTGAGGAFTTANDMEKFWIGLTNKKFFNLLSTFEDMIIPQTGEKYYGYGFWLRGKNPVMQGSEPGISFISIFDINKNNIITLISNYGNNVWHLLDEILEDEFY